MDVDLDPLAEVVFVRFLHCKVTSPCFPAILIERKSSFTAQAEGADSESLSLGQRVL